MVGAAFLTGAVADDSLPGPEPLVDFYARKYRYRREEAAGMRQDRRAWVAVPIADPGGVVRAVLFADAAEAGFFGRANSPRRVLLAAAGVAVTKMLTHPR